MNLLYGLTGDLNPFSAYADSDAACVKKKESGCAGRHSLSGEQKKVAPASRSLLPLVALVTPKRRNTAG